MRLGLMVMVAAMLATGCFAGSSDAGGGTDDFIDMDTPPGNCSADTGAAPCPTPGTGGAGEGEPCLSSGYCADGNSCVAPYVDGQAGQFVCTSQCIGLMDETQWCLDSGACCDAGAICSSRGFCMMPEDDGLDSSGGSTEGTASGGDTTAGSGTEGSGSSGRSDGSGTGNASTGGSTGTTGAG